MVGALRLVVKRAIREQLIRHDPFVGVESLAATPKRRGILEPEEVRYLFSLGSEAWPDPNARVLNMLAAACSLRKGELQGLRRKCVQETVLADDRVAAVLVVNASWEQSGRLKSTKNGRERLAPVPPVVVSDLSQIMSHSPYQGTDHFVFYFGRFIAAGQPSQNRRGLRSRPGCGGDRRGGQTCTVYLLSQLETLGKLGFGERRSPPAPRPASDRPYVAADDVELPALRPGLLRRPDHH